MPSVSNLVTVFNPEQAKLICEQAGWTDVDEAWSYSGGTLTVPSDATTRFQVGDKISLVDSTTKYFYVVGVTTTTLTLSGGSDYALSGSTFSSIKFSRHLNPKGFPSSFSYTPGMYFDGGAWTVVSRTARFSMEAGKVNLFANLRGTLSGVASPTISFDLPVAATQNTMSPYNYMYVYGTSQLTWSPWQINSGYSLNRVAVGNWYPVAFANFPNSGDVAIQGQMFYWVA